MFLMKLYVKTVLKTWWETFGIYKEFDCCDELDEYK